MEWMAANTQPTTIIITFIEEQTTANKHRFCPRKWEQKEGRERVKKKSDEVSFIDTRQTAMCMCVSGYLCLNGLDKHLLPWLYIMDGYRPNTNTYTHPD